MNVGFQDFRPDVPDKDFYERGVDYLWQDFDLDLADTFNLLKQLKTNRSSLVVYAPSVIVDFYIFDNMLCVQIDGDGFWHESDLDLETAKEILRVAFDGCDDFGSQVPGTNRHWEGHPLWADVLT